MYVKKVFRELKITASVKKIRSTLLFVYFNSHFNARPTNFSEENESLPVLAFLMSTYNYKHNEIVIIEFSYIFRNVEFKNWLRMVFL